MAGSIKRRGATWTVVYDLAPDPLTNRRRQRRVGGFRTRREAEQELTKLLRERDTGSALDPTRLTVAEYLTHWLETDVRHRVRQGTYQVYGERLARYLVPHLGAVLLSDLRPAHVSMLLGALRDRGLGVGTISSTRVVLHAALKRAVLWQLLPRNVCDAVPAPRTTRPVRQLWDEATVQRFRAALQTEPLGAYFGLAIVTGMRRGELLGLRWADVDLDGGWLVVRRALVKSVGGLREEATKSGKGRRIDLTASQVAMLRAQRQAQLTARLAAGPAWQDQGLVFAQEPSGFPTALPGGRPFAPTSLGRHWHALLARHGLPHIRPHDLRHLNATLLLEAGVHPKVVQERLGHANVSITLDTYSHVTPTLGRAAAELLDERLQSPPDAHSGPHSEHS